MTLQSLWLLTRKNLRLLLRAKSSALIVLLAPLLTILILGLSYNTSSQYGLNIGVYAPAFTDDVNSVINTLQEKDFKVVKYETSIDECVQDIKIGAIHTCLSLPENFAVEGNTPKEVTFYLDASKINLVWMIQETLKTHINFKAQEVSTQLSQDILTRLMDTKSKIGEQQSQTQSIKDKNSGALASTDTAKSSLTGLDLTVPATVYDRSVVGSFQTNLSADLNTSLQKITDAKTALTEVNISAADRSRINSLLTAANERLTGAMTLVTGTQANSLQSISALIDGLQQDLDSTKTKLTAAASSVTTAASSLDTVSSNLNEGITAIDSVQTALNGIQSTLEGAKLTDAATIATPITTRIERVSKESTYLNYSFPTLLVLVIMFTSLLLGTILVMMEKNSPAFLRNYFLPVNKATFVISIYLTNLVLILVQIVIILGISLFFLRDALPLVAPIVLVLFVAASLFTFLGMAIGYIFTSEETGVLASISLGSILLFISGAILPLETISPLLRKIAYFNPFVLSEKIIRELFIFNSSLLDVGTEVLILVGYTIALFIIILIIESVLHQHLMRKFMKQHHKAHIQTDKQQKNDI